MLPRLFLWCSFPGKGGEKIYHKGTKTLRNDRAKNPFHLSVSASRKYSIESVLTILRSVRLWHCPLKIISLCLSGEKIYHKGTKTLRNDPGKTLSCLSVSVPEKYTMAAARISLTAGRPVQLLLRVSLFPKRGHQLTSSRVDPRHGRPWKVRCGRRTLAG
jgi:hypothetical protein